MTADSPIRSAMRAILPHLPAAGLFFALSFVVTQPIWLEPAARIAGRGDALLNSYILDWVHYALFHQVSDFFQATVFWPHADSLAYGEHLLVPALLILPMRVFTSSAVALHNFSVIQAFFFSALSAYALAHFYFRSRIPATVAGLVYGFAQYRMVQSGHIQLAHGEFLPLAALAIEMLLRRESRNASIILGVALAAQALTSWYWAVFTFWCIGPFLILRLWQSRAIIWKPLLMHLFIPCVAAVLVTLPIAKPYIELTHKNILVRPKEASEGLSARPSDYLVPSPRYWFAAPVKETPHMLPVSERQLFLGLAPLVLGLFGFGLAFRRRTRSDSTPADSAAFPLRAWSAILLLMLVFSFGSWLPIGTESSFSIPMPYLIVEKLFPFSSGVRVTARWVLPALLPAGLLAAHGVSAILQALQRRGNSLAMLGVPIILCFALIGDALPKPSRYLSIPRIQPAFCGWLAKQPYPTPIIELPILQDTDNLYMLHATWHRQPTMNGTNGFFPPDHQGLLREIGAFGSPNIFTKLRELKVKHIIIHPEAYPIEKMALTPMGKLLKDAADKSAGGDFKLQVLGETFTARKIGDAIVLDL